MKKRIRNGVLLLTCLLLLAGGLPFAAAGETACGFYLAAFTRNRTLIEPVRVTYTEGQSVQEALAASGYLFAGLEEGWISEIEGEAGSFYRYYDGLGYDLNVPANSITALYFTEAENGCEEALSLLAVMGAYRERTDHIQNYPAAKTAYENALDGLRAADASALPALLTEMQNAVSAYDAYLSGTKYHVSFNVTGDANAVMLTDVYGNSVPVKNMQADAVAGEYIFTVSDGASNRTEGTFTVAGDTALQIALPAGDWFGEINLLNKEKNAYRSENTGAALRVFVPDTAGYSDVYLNALLGDVPDPATTVLRTLYTGTNGADMAEVPRSWNSTRTLLSYLLAKGCGGASLTLEAQYRNAQGHLQVQSRNVEIERIPTLSALTLWDGGTQVYFPFAPLTNDYTVTALQKDLGVQAQPFLPDYTVSSSRNGDTLRVNVACGTLTNEYRVKVNTVAPARVTLTAPAGTEAALSGPGDTPVSPTDGVYLLIPGEEYSYTTTKDTYFHATAAFTAADGLTVTAAAPATQDLLTDAAFFNASSARTRAEYALSSSFDPGTHAYGLTVPDASAALYVQGTPDGGSTLFAEYNAMSVKNADQHGLPTEKQISKTVNAAAAADFLTNAIAPCGYGQKVTLRLKKDGGNGVTYWQDYDFSITRSLHLQSLAITAETEALQLLDGSGKTVAYDRYIYDYTVNIYPDTLTVTLQSAFMNETDETPCCGGYSAVINGQTYESLSDVTVTLAENTEDETVTVSLAHASGASGEYRVRFHRQPPVAVSFRTDPADATVFITNAQTGKPVYAAQGVFLLNAGQTYTYTVTKNGYVGVREPSFVAPQTDTGIDITLSEVQENVEIAKPDAFWAGTRFDANNNAALNVKTPIAAEDAVLYWATKIGSGYSSDACGCPILVDGYLYTYAGKRIYKVDTVTGEIAAEGQMDHSSSFAINAPTYADGMIFVGLSDGCVQAFNARTLESLWLYRDALGGQPNCPIAYRNGYIYTGFWISETSNANCVCLSVADEDPANGLEEKLPTWTYTHKGGFYWAGAYVCDTFLAVGTDDGKPGRKDGSGNLITFDPLTGAPIDSVTLTGAGDIRSTVMRDTETGLFCFTAENGKFYIADIGGDGKISQLDAVPLLNGAGPAMSTSTPTVYNGRAYVGVCGTSQFGPYSGHAIAVVDITKKQVVYSVPTQGYPQTSGLLTTAYSEADGTVYVYFFDNYTPGKLRMLCDKPGQTKAVLTTRETYTAGGVEKTCDAAYCLFTPADAQAQYAICSPIADEYGTLYFKNDSAYLMAVGSTVTGLTVTAPPDKTAYRSGETFDPAGMTVTATYANGLTRDVTKYVSWSTQPLTADDTELEIRFEHTLYQNCGDAAGVVYTAPSAVIRLTVSTDGTGPSTESFPYNGVNRMLQRIINWLRNLIAMFRDMFADKEH